MLVAHLVEDVGGGRGDGAVGEVEDARGAVGEDEADAGEAVDGAGGEADDDEGQDLAHYPKHLIWPSLVNALPLITTGQPQTG